ncbi:hypothetical protein niasHT_004842 [Heterodera trifolii]|uniref:FAD-binding PCMH-type domain-containing protein n=1 Tax=Heterodera trifolii TaxID=157864 RepID=A0ABD2LUI1_9BILA
MLFVADIAHGKGQKEDKSEAKCYDHNNNEAIRSEVQQIVRRAQKLRVFGSRHSFNKIADSCGTLLSTLGMNSIIAINGSRPTVTVQPGITYTDLAPRLCQLKMEKKSGIEKTQFPTLAGIAEITVAGATQTCAHGGGLSNTNLATQVRSMRIVLANGTEASFGPESAELRAVACGLGAFGVITEVELNLVPTFDTISYNFVSLPTESLYEHFDEIQKMGNHVLMLTTFANNSSSMWDRVTSEANKVQPWYYGLLQFRLGLSGRDGNLSDLFPQIRSVVAAVVIRTVKGDNLWLSMNNGNGPTVGIHFSWADNRPSKANHALAQIEKVLTKFGARPHWGKYFTMKPSQFLKSSIYPHLSDFRKLAENLDPTHKFRNKFINENIFDETAEQIDD